MRGVAVIVLGGFLAMVVGGCADDAGSESTETVAVASVETTAAAGSTAAPETTLARVTTVPETTRAPDDDPLLVTTDLGQVRGAPSGEPGVRAFRAMPYAAEPTGDARWLPPQPREPYDGVFDATRAGGTCPQGEPEVPMLVIPDSVEDCLTVSVWTPDDADGLPVIVWIHGGTLRMESAEDPLTVGDRLAAHGAVVVGVNYRLGPLGFLALDELVAAGVTGNQGFSDQVAALEWVQRNIAAFGGDPGNVTLVGESAGGAAVCAHLVSPASSGLFDKVVAQSATLGLGAFARQPIDLIGGCDRVDAPEQALERGRELMQSVGCDDLACMRERSDEDLIAVPYSATIVDDGVLVDGTAIDAASRGALDDIPIMLTSNGTEATLFTLGMAEPTDEELRALFAEVSDRPDELLALYPPAEGTANLDRYRAMLTDSRFACRNVAFAEASSGATFLVLNDYHSESDPFGVGPTHGTELVTLFGHPEGINGLSPEFTDPVVAEISEAMQVAWVQFAATGDPGELFVDYGTDPRITVMVDPIVLVDELAGGRCDELIDLTS